jgi:hypothetical protein
MSKCPSCGRNVPVFKDWDYGPKTRKGVHMLVKLYHCKCGEVFREYHSKKSGKVTRARKPYQKRK